MRFSRRSSIQASGPAEAPRRPDEEDVFRDQRHLLAEAAADIGRDDAKLALGHAEAIGDAGAEHVRHLGRAGERDAAGAAVEGGVAAARLERHGVLPARADVDLDHRRGIGDRLGEALGLDLALDQDVAGGMGMNERRAGRERGIDIDHGVLGIDVDEDLLGDVLRLLAARRDHGRDRLAGEGDMASRRGSAARPAHSPAGGGAGGCRRRRRDRRR